jgi:hypothetical protein
MTVAPIDHQPNLNEVPPNSVASVIDFFEARHQLLTGAEGIVQEKEMDRQIQESVIRRERSLEAPRRLSWKSKGTAMFDINSKFAVNCQRVPANDIPGRLIENSGPQEVENCSEGWRNQTREFTLDSFTSKLVVSQRGEQSCVLFVASCSLIH